MREPEASMVCVKDRSAVITPTIERECESCGSTVWPSTGVVEELERQFDLIHFVCVECIKRQVDQDPNSVGDVRVTEGTKAWFASLGHDPGALNDLDQSDLQRLAEDQDASP